MLFSVISQGVQRLETCLQLGRNLKLLLFGTSETLAPVDDTFAPACQISLINQLDEDDRNTDFKIIDTMLTKKKFKDFFQKNVAAL